MDEAGTEKDLNLIQAAAEAVDRAVAHLFDGQETVPSFSPTDLAALSPAEREDALRVEREAYRERPEWAAIHFCLTSSSALLDVSRSLLQEPADHSAAEQVSRIKKMVADTKAAGRAAYRAALILAATTTD